MYENTSPLLTSTVITNITEIDKLQGVRLGPPPPRHRPLRHNHSHYLPHQHRLERGLQRHDLPDHSRTLLFIRNCDRTNTHQEAQERASPVRPMEDGQALGYPGQYRFDLFLDHHYLLLVLSRGVASHANKYELVDCGIYGRVSPGLGVVFG